jgi:hypothetical protein
LTNAIFTTGTAAHPNPEKPGSLPRRARRIFFATTFRIFQIIT